MRVRFFGLSLIIHSSIALLLASVKSFPPQIITPQEVFRPQDYKIVYYRPKPKVQEVTPVKKLGDSASARGTEISTKTIVATSPKALSKDQLILTPLPKITIPKDLPLPNLIASIKAAPPPNDLPTSAPPATKPPPRVFIPQAVKPALPLPQPVVLTSLDPPVASSTTPMPPANASIGSISTIPSAVPPAPIVKQGDDKVDIAIASLHPVASKTEVPEGSRGAKFSGAPEKGIAASGDTNRASATVPNLTMHEEKKATVVAPELKPTRTVLYSERVRTVPSSTLSVPLRAAARSIPRALELRFQGRSVYTMVVPIENLPAYSGDWIIWFAEREQKPGTAPSVRAPLPFRKLEPIDGQAGGAHSEQRIQIAAVVKHDGRLEDAAVLTKIAPSVASAALHDLAAWEFKPASRDGSPIDVDVVIEIPFSFPQAMMTRTP